MRTRLPEAQVLSTRRVRDGCPAPRLALALGTAGLLVVAGALRPAGVLADPAGTGTFTITISRFDGSASGELFWDDVAFDVFGSPQVNLGDSVGPMFISGGSFSSASGSPPSGTFSTGFLSLMPGVLRLAAEGDYVCPQSPGPQCEDQAPLPPFGGSFDASFVGDVTALLGTLIDDGTLPTGPDIFYTIDGSALCALHLVVEEFQCPIGTIALNAFRGIYTPTGPDVSVTVDTSFFNPKSGDEVPVHIDVTYAEVTGDGHTVVTTTSQAAGELSSNFAVEVGDFKAVFFDVSLSGGSFNPPVRICTLYPDEDDDGIVDGSDILGPSAQECDLRIVHEEAGVFVDRTLAASDPACPAVDLCPEEPGEEIPCIDVAANEICAELPDLSVSAVLPTIDKTCRGQWPKTSFTTVAKGQKAENNDKVSHVVTAHVVGGAEAHGKRASRIKVCRGTPVTISIFDDSTVSAVPIVDALSEGIECALGPGIGDPDAEANCVVEALMATAKYRVSSHDGSDTDRVTLVPVP
jgi:hypothetical protein